LGLVIERPSYGYELGRRLEERFGGWGWEPTGVYSALSKLEEDGHVQSRGEKGSTRRGAPRVIYEPTPEGVASFEAWISKSSAPSPFRQELDLKILLAGSEFLPQLIEQNRAQEQTCIDNLRDLTSAGQVAPAGRMSSWREAAPVLQRDAEIMLLETRIKWLQNARETMRMILERSTGNQRG